MTSTIQVFEDRIVKLEKMLVDQTDKSNSELVKATEQISELQAELFQKTAMVEGMVDKAIKDIKAKLVGEFKQEKVGMMDRINALEKELKESREKTLVAETGRTTLIDVNNKLEHQLICFKKAQDPKVKLLLEKAADDADFMEKILDAANKFDMIKPVDAIDEEKEKLEKENTSLKEKVKELQKYLDDGADFIEMLQKEIRDLRDNLPEDKVSSKFGLSLQNSNQESRFLSNPGFLPLNSACDSPVKPSSPRVETELSLWQDVLFIREGSSLASESIALLSAEVKLLKVRLEEQQNSLISTTRYLEDSKNEAKKKSEEIGRLQGEMQKTREDLGSKSIQLNNAMLKLTELRHMLESIDKSDTEVCRMIAVIDDPIENTEVEEVTVCNIKDISDKLKANKQQLVSASKHEQQPTVDIDVKEVQIKCQTLAQENEELKCKLEQLAAGTLNTNKHNAFESGKETIDISIQTEADTEAITPLVHHHIEASDRLFKESTLLVESSIKVDQTPQLEGQYHVQPHAIDSFVDLEAKSLPEQHALDQPHSTLFSVAVTPPPIDDQHTALALPTALGDFGSPSFKPVDSFAPNGPPLPHYGGHQEIQKETPKFNKADSFETGTLPALPLYKATEGNEVRDSIGETNQPAIQALPKSNSAVTDFQPNYESYFSVKPTRVEELSAIQEPAINQEEGNAAMASVVLVSAKGSNN